MRYISDDGKVFNTEQECLEHENTERIERAHREAARKNKLEAIRERYNELEKLIHEYEKSYGSTKEIYFMPFSDIVSMLAG